MDGAVQFLEHMQVKNAEKQERQRNHRLEILILWSMALVALVAAWLVFALAYSMYVGK